MKFAMGRWDDGTMRRKSVFRVAWAFVVAAALFCHAGALQAQVMSDSLLDARTKEVSAQLRCPVCQGLSLADSPSELSLQMKQVVRDQLKAGKSPEEVKAYFVSKYGEWILLEPKPRGMNLLVYLLPLVLLLGGFGLIVVVVRKWTAARPDGQEQTESLSNEEVANVSG